MRYALGLALAAALLWTPAGCRRGRNGSEAASGGPRVAATVRMGDPKSAGQLVSGFHDIEDNAWRWTGRKFAVDVGTPPGAAQKGATLEFDFTVPQPVIDQLKSVAVSATVDGNVLPPESYSQPGTYSYQRDVPAALLGKESVRVEFELDKAIPPGPGDQRELGVVASSVGLKTK
jgi:hypothetical protein